ncbi:MAG TPA: chromate transporter [Bacillota bacterium]|jgi:chromate transporter|nr:chromate transporter [Bacillota bacterium]HOL11227.1 chromate transporter [Bacillota bacterium]HPO98935.1 chromate transporter [Bacillota bacterium]
MIYFQLLWTFFKIGIFSFGGGYVMIPLIQKEIELHGWIYSNEFADIVAISQMTPGPIAVNTATYVGARVAGFWGSFFATLGVSLPSFILTLVIVRFLKRFSNNATVEAILKGVRPVTIGLIATAVVFFAEMSILKTDFLIIIKRIISKNIIHLLTANINYGSLLIFTVILIGVKYFKLNPILAVFLAAVLGGFLT